MNNEQLAIQFCQRKEGRFFQYQKKDDPRCGRIGSFSVLYDMNCCAPTDTVLFAFVSEKTRSVMKADELMEFVNYCKELD